MALEIRPYREEEAQAFYRVPQIVFGNYTGQRDPAGPERRRHPAPSGRSARSKTACSRRRTARSRSSSG